MACLIIFSVKNMSSDELIFAGIKSYSKIFKVSFPELSIERKGGKPYFSHNGKKYDEIKFSVTHSGAIMAVAISDGGVGIDIEKHIDRTFEVISKRVFAEEITNKKEFYERWTRGEAHVKYAETDFFTGMKDKSVAENIDLFDGYSFAAEVAGGIYLQEVL